MEDCKGLIFCHVDLIQNAKAALFCALQNRTFAERHLSVLKGVRPNERCGIRINIEGDVPLGSAKRRRQALCQHVFAGCLRPHQKKIFTCKEGGKRLLPDFFSVIGILRGWNPSLHFFF